MDVFETIRIAARRWYVFAPVFVVVALITLYVLSLMPSEYETSATVVVVPPSSSTKVPTTADNTSTTVTVKTNPYLAGSQTVAASVLQTALSSPQVASMLKEQGVTGSWKVVQRADSPVLDITSTADSEQKAREWAAKIVDQSKATFEDLQTAVGAPRDQLIQLDVISPPTEAKPQYGSRIRVGVALGAVALGLAFASAFLFDGVESRRRDVTEPDATDDDAAEGDGDDVARWQRLAAEPLTPVSAGAERTHPFQAPRASPGTSS